MGEVGALAFVPAHSCSFFRSVHNPSSGSPHKTMETAPYGSWKSPITSDLIVKGSIGLFQVRLDGDDIYWIELRPSEGGRQVIVRRTPDGQMHDLTPREMNARTRVHEYGGGEYLIHKGDAFFSNFTDQQLYHQPAGAAPADDYERQCRRCDALRRQRL